MDDGSKGRMPLSHSIRSLEQLYSVIGGDLEPILICRQLWPDENVRGDSRNQLQEQMFVPNLRPRYFDMVSLFQTFRTLDRGSLPSGWPHKLFKAVDVSFASSSVMRSILLVSAFGRNREAGLTKRLSESSSHSFYDDLVAVIRAKRSKPREMAEEVLS